MTDDTLATYHLALCDLVAAAQALALAWLPVLMSPPPGANAVLEQIPPAVAEMIERDVIRDDPEARDAFAEALTTAAGELERIADSLQGAEEELDREAPAP